MRSFHSKTTLMFLILFGLAIYPGFAGSLPPNQVASDSDPASNSLASIGGQKLVVDGLGKYLVSYVDTSGRLAISYANGDPRLAPAWSPAAKSQAPSFAYKHPAMVVTGQNGLRIIAEGGAADQNLVDISVTLTRDSGGNIVGVSYGAAQVLDNSGFSFYPSAIQAHDGTIIVVWNIKQTGVVSKVNALRWTVQTGWTSVSNPASAQPDTAIIDTSNTYAIFPNIIERKDDYKLYVLGNRGSSSSSTRLVFNSATYNGSTWTWSTQSLSYENDASRGIEDAVSLTWDPVRSQVVAVYDVSGTSRYGVFTLDSSNKKTHVDTPNLVVSDNDWANIGVDRTTGDYYIFILNANVDGGSGSLGYTARKAGSWNTTLTLIDSDSTNQGVSIQRSTDAALNIIYVKGTSTPTSVKFFSLPTSTLNQSAITLAVNPSSSVMSQSVSFSGKLSDSTTGDGMGGYTVEIQRSFSLASWTAVVDTTTSPDGSYSADQSFSSPTTYHLRASFSGQGAYLGSVSPVVDEVVTAPESGNFAFAVGGDLDALTGTTLSLDALGNAGVNFFLAIGDLSYGTLSPESAWCDYVTSHIGSTFPFQLLSGNHEDGIEEPGQGLIDNFSTCLPNRVGSIYGTYAKEYYFDYPATNALARIILISPNLNFTNGGHYSYKNGSIHYAWLSNAIDSARTAGIPWVIVGMHKACISEGVSGCEVGKDLMNLLISKRVDLVLQAHNHNYERSKQLTCAYVGYFDATCVANDGSTDTYQKGVGTVFVTQGIFGAGLTPINASDPEATYFATAYGLGSPAAGKGFVEYTVTPSKFYAKLVLASGGPFADGFTIGPNTPPFLNVPGTQTVRERSSIRFRVSAADSDLPLQTVTLSAAGLPSGALFPATNGNPATSDFSWSPAEGQRGNYAITFTAIDDGTPSMSTRETVTVTVYPSNPSTITILSSPNPSNDTQTVVISGLLTDPSNSTGLGSRAVNVEQSLDQTTWTLLLHTTTLNEGSYQVTASFQAGTLYIRSTFEGDPNYSPATSPIIAQLVKLKPYSLITSNDGKVYKDQDGALTLLGQPTTKHLLGVDWRPDGSYALLVGSGGTLLRYDGNRFTLVPTFTSKNLYEVAWRPDGSYALIVGDGGTVLKYDGVAVTKIPSPLTNTILALSWSPNASLALLVGKGGAILVYQNNVIRFVKSGTNSDLYAVAWNPNGQYALIAGSKGTVLSYNGNTTILQTSTIYSSSLTVRSVAWIPDGTQALLVGDAGLVLKFNGTALVRLQTLTGNKLWGVGWVGGTATIVGDNGTLLSYDTFTLQKLTSGFSSPFRGIDWRES